MKVNVPELPVPYFQVSPAKLYLLDAFTFGIYGKCWAYKHARRKSSVLAAAVQALFAPLYLFGMAQRVKVDARANEIKCNYYAKGLAAIYALGVASATSPTIPLRATLALGVVTSLALIPIQKTMNRVNAARFPAHVFESRFSEWDGAAVFTGLLMWTLVGVSMLGIHGVQKEPDQTAAPFAQPQLVATAQPASMALAPQVNEPLAPVMIATPIPLNPFEAAQLRSWRRALETFPEVEDKNSWFRSQYKLIGKRLSAARDPKVYAINAPEIKMKNTTRQNASVSWIAPTKTSTINLDEVNDKIDKLNESSSH